MPILSGMVYCADCGSINCIRSDVKVVHTKRNTWCVQSIVKKGKKLVTSHQIRNVEIEAALLSAHPTSYCKGKISDDRFMKMTATYEAEQNELKERIAELEAIITAAKEKSANVDSFLEIVHTYTDIQELNAEIIRTFIEKVYVYQSEKLWSRNTKKLKIVFNFIEN